MAPYGSDRDTPDAGDTSFQASKLRTYSTSDLQKQGKDREFIVLAGKDGTGKTCALISFAAYIEMLQPEAQFFVIDLEGKFKGALHSFKRDAPGNLVYIPVTDINEATEALDRIVLKQYRPGDWLGVDSFARLWDRAQDMGYQVITGAGKMAYMEKRREFATKNPGAKAPPVTPRPDDLWSIIKGAHDGAFMDVLAGLSDLNVIGTTAVKKAPQERANRQESQDRKDVRAEFGIDANLDGAPKLPYYALTLAMLTTERGKGRMRILRDNNSELEEPRIEFGVDGRKDWCADFYTNCR